MRKPCATAMRMQKHIANDRRMCLVVLLFMMMKRCLSIVLAVLAASFCLPRLEAADDSALETIRRVGQEGQGNADASVAWKDIAAGGPERIQAVFKAMNDTNPLAQNWLRAAVETMAGRALDAGALPADDLAVVVRDTANDAAPRLLAYELLLAHQPALAAEIRPALLHDPAAELRIFAVADLIEQGQAAVEKDDKAAAVAAYRKALSGARDEEQIGVLAKGLRDLGETVNLPEHFGFLMSWHLIAPFSNVDRAGFDSVFPPEEKVDLRASHPGKGAEAKWQPYTSEDEYGMVDFNEPFGMLKEVTGYAYTEFESDTERAAEIRLGCKNGWKVWLNGELLFGRDEYHRGMKLDQYKLPCRLKKGKNTLLVKCCQNEQTEQWTVEWRFQLRVCDATGTAILAQN